MISHHKYSINQPKLKTKDMTLKDLYNRARKSPTPGVAFIAEVHLTFEKGPRYSN